MSFLRTLVRDLVLLLTRDKMDLKSISRDMKMPGWCRRKHSQRALDDIQKRWLEDESVTTLIDELVMLRTPENGVSGYKLQNKIRSDYRFGKNRETRADLPPCQKSI